MRVEGGGLLLQDSALPEPIVAGVEGDSLLSPKGALREVLATFMFSRDVS